MNKIILLLLGVFVLGIIAMSIWQENVQGAEEVYLGGTENKTCVSLVGTTTALTQKQAEQYQKCLLDMISEIHSGGYKIGNQGTMSLGEEVSLKKIKNWYKQKTRAVGLDTKSKLIQKVSVQEELELVQEKINFVKDK